MQTEYPIDKTMAVDSPRTPVLESLTKENISLRRQCASLRVEDGWLIGFDSGEWGGALYWSSDSGETYYQILPSFQVNNFFQRRDGIFATEGMANMSINRGGIIKIEQNTQGIWNAEKVVELPAKPRKILSITSDGTVTFELYWDSSVVKVNPDWTFAYRKPGKKQFWTWWVLPVVILGIARFVKFLLE